MNLATIPEGTPSKCGSMAENVRWFVIRSKQRQEPRAATNLSAFGIETLLPRMPVRKSSNLFHAFFPGYLFARFDRFADLHRIRTTHGVHSVLTFAGQPVPVDNGIIEIIRERMDKRGFVQSAIKMALGTVVRITRGPFADLTAIFEREVSGTERIIVLLNAVSFKAQIDISRFDVTPIH